MIALKKMIVPNAPNAYQAAPMIENRIIPPMPTASATPTTHNQNFPPSSSTSTPFSAGSSFASSHRGGIVLNGRNGGSPTLPAPPGHMAEAAEERPKHR